MLYKLFKKIIARLEPIYGITEANAIARRLLDDGHGIGRKELILNPSAELSDNVYNKIKEQIKMLENEKPIQYIVGFQEFRSRNFIVNESVLIPRQETEELVNHIIEECHGSPKILDIGTGSGAIAISLALDIQGSTVTAWDISESALNVARSNAEKLGAKVKFETVDIFATQDVNEKFDIIVSNPPYVLESEKEYMKRNVTDYEPDVALYVNDTNPLIFYEKIAQFAIKHLTPKGKLYFEINSKFAQETAQLLHDYENITITQDIHGANRIISCNAK